MAVTTLRDYTAESIREHLGDLENYPKETLVTYEEFLVDDKTYYFTPGGFCTARTQGRKRWEASFAATSPTRYGNTGLLEHSSNDHGLRKGAPRPSD